jgi:large subunit ribosomal protein L21
MYAIVKTGGKQYRVEPGRWLLVERLPVSEGDSVDLTPLLVVDGDELLDGDAVSGVTVKATVLAHERGPKLRVVKFKPKRGYKRRNGHRQELTRIQIEGIDRGASSARASSTAAPKPAKAPADAEPVAAASGSEASDGS